MASTWADGCVFFSALVDGQGIGEAVVENSIALNKFSVGPHLVALFLPTRENCLKLKVPIVQGKNLTSFSISNLETYKSLEPVSESPFVFEAPLAPALSRTGKAKA